MWDDTESSSVTTCPAIQYSESKDTRRQSRDVLKMLHQIQADALVKNEFVGQLEKQRDQLAQMKISYDEKLSELKSQHLDRSQYEVKLKRLTAENADLKKKIAQSTPLDRVRITNRLKQEVQVLKLDNKKLSQQLKHVTGKARESDVQHQKDIQHLKRRVHVTMEAKKKCEKANELQAKNLQKKTEETAAATMQLRQLTNALRKAASEGSFLNETTLDKILSTVRK
jgi:hypothetical protein